MVDLDKYQKLEDARQNAACVTEIYLKDTPFSEEDIKLFKHITRLNFFDVQKLEFDGIGRFTNLEYLEIIGCNIRKWALEPFLLINLKQVKLSYNQPKKFLPFQKLFQKVVKEQYPPELRRLLFYLLSRDAKQLKPYTNLQILGALVCDMPEMYAAVETELMARKANPLQNNPLIKNSTVYLAGNFDTSLEQITNKLQAQGITVTTKLTKDTTHAILGMKPKESLEELIKNNITLLIESQVKDFLNSADPPYLMEANASRMVANVNELLMSAEESNQLTGIELLRTGGVTGETLTHLAVLKFIGTSTEVVDGAIALINQYGSASLRVAIKKTSWFDESVTEPTIYKNINKLVKGTELDGLLFAYHLFRINGRGRRYLLNKGTAAMRKEVIEKSLKHNGTQLDLTYVHVTKLPEEIYGYENISRINLFYHELESLPTGIGRMKKLEKLNLYGKPMESFPDDFFALSSLKKLFIRVNDYSLITEAFAKLPLEELCIFNTQGIGAFPENLFYLIPTLKKLQVGSAFAEGSYDKNENRLCYSSREAVLAKISPQYKRLESRTEFENLI